MAAACFLSCILSGPLLYNRQQNVLSASLNKTFPSFMSIFLPSPLRLLHRLLSLSLSPISAKKKKKKRGKEKKKKHDNNTKFYLIFFTKRSKTETTNILAYPLACWKTKSCIANNTDVLSITNHILIHRQWVI